MMGPPLHRSRRRFSTLLTAVLVLGTLIPVQAGTAVVAAASRGDSPCAAMTAPVFQRINPSTSANLLTRSVSESARVTQLGFTEDHGSPFRAATAPGAGLVGAHRMFLPRLGNLVWMTSPTEIARAKRQGYSDHGVNFFVSNKPGPCLTPVYRYRKAGFHRFAVGDTENSTAAKGGWVREGAAFYAAPPVPTATGDTKFSIVVYPDTQREVTIAGDPRFPNRVKWTLDNRRRLDARFLVQTGDLVNWDSPKHEQYVRAQQGMGLLSAAGLPYAIAVGNHDTGAVCGSGSACPGKRIRLAVRDTSTINRFFPSTGFPAMKDQFEPKKIDNAFSTFSAGGRQWLVLTLELWARTSAVQWARSVIAAHPHHNVIIATHSYLNADGTINQTNGGYGTNTSEYIYEQLVRPFANVRIVLSGHVGTAASRADKGSNGNTVVSILSTFHSINTNPIQILEIDTASNTASTRFYAPYTKTDYPQFSRTFYGMGWVG